MGRVIVAAFLLLAAPIAFAETLTGKVLALKLFDKELALALPVLPALPTLGDALLVAPRGGGEAKRLRACR